MKKAMSKIWNISVYLLFAISVLLAFSVFWMIQTWPGLHMDELVFHLVQGVSGAGENMVEDYVVKAILPSILSIFLLAFIFYRTKKSDHEKKIIAAALSGACLVIAAASVYASTDVGEYVISRSKESGFIHENYADPSCVEMTFPDQKRNLIYIFLESMEITYADEENGGAFEENVIPELTKLAEENETFSGDEHLLNGAYSLPGTTWTMGGMFAATSGLPLQISIKDNDMSKQAQFFPSITVLGDILEQEGYWNVLLIGSNAGFAGRKLYFESHGDYEMRDYHYAIDHGLIDPDYKVWWGYEDNKLIRFAKDTLDELSSSKEPFNLTILTVDTHFENGYVCEDCPDTFGNNQYANVMACSSKKISEFINWCKTQPWYENTSIVISGDHPTMDRDFCNQVTGYDRRVYTAYINAAAENRKPHENRIYSTFDHFPTTLAALGVSIEGERLGLGTNLFSGKQTLCEELGVRDETALLKQKSSFMEAISGVSVSAKDLYKEGNSLVKADVRIKGYEKKTGWLAVEARDILIGNGALHKVHFVLEDETGTRFYEGKAEKDGSYSAIVHVKPDQLDKCSLRISASYLENGKICAGTVFGYADGSLLFAGELQENPAGYIEYLSSLDPKRFVVLLSGQGDFTAALNKEIMDSLFDLGCLNDLSTQRNISYIAIRDQSGMYEQSSLNVLRYKGKAGNNLNVQMISASEQEGSISSIRIDDGISGNREYSLKKDGLNIVVYDQKENTVVSRASFDTVTQPPYADVQIAENKDGNLEIKIETIRNKNNVTDVYGILFDEVNPASKIPFTLKQDDDGVFSGRVSVKDVNAKTMHLRIMASDLSGVPVIIYKEDRTDTDS